MRKLNAMLTPFAYGDILSGGAGNDRIYADNRMSVPDAIATGNLVGSGIDQQGDWMRWRTRGVIIQSGKAANDESANAWGIAA